MAIDASIPLQVHSLKIPTAGEVMSLKDLAVRSQINEQNLQEKTMEVQKRNNLLQITQSPGFSDPNSGTPTPQGIAAYTRIDPEGGIKLSQMAQQMNIQNMAIDEKRTAVKRNILTGYVESYQRNLQLSGDKAQAEKAAREETMAAIQEGKKSGHYANQGFSANELEHELPPPEMARTAVLAMGGKIAEAPKSETDIGKLHDDLVAGRITQQDYTQKKQQLLVDPVQMEQTAQGIAKGQLAPLSSFALKTPQGIRTMARVMEINPDYQASDFTTKQTAEKAFATGKQGNTIKSFNVALEHLNTLDRLSDALNNNDVQAINKIGNYFSTQSGRPAPTNFAAAKKIVADEIVKAIVGSGGGVTDREEAAKTVNAANSPAQLKGVIKTYQELMSGQLVGLRQQYEAIPGEKKSFDRFLSPTAKKLVAAGKAPEEVSKPDIKSLLEKYK
jgi:hypothetical protein